MAKGAQDLLLEKMPLDRFLTTFNDWNPKKEYHDLTIKDPTVREDARRQGFALEVSPKGTYYEKSKKHPPKPSNQKESMVKSNCSNLPGPSRPLPASQTACNQKKPKRKPYTLYYPPPPANLRTNQRKAHQASIHEEVVRIGRTLQGTYQQIEAMRARNRASGPRRPPQEEENNKRN